MRIERLTWGFWLLALSVGVLLGLGGNLFGSAGAEQQQNGVGRYQVSAWGAYSGERVHHSGYYVLDTATGKIVDSGHETHSIEGPVPPRE